MNFVHFFISPTCITSINSAVNHRTPRARPKVTLFGDTFYTHTHTHTLTCTSQTHAYNHTTAHTHIHTIYDERDIGRRRTWNIARSHCCVVLYIRYYNIYFTQRVQVYIYTHACTYIVVKYESPVHIDYRCNTTRTYVYIYIHTYTWVHILCIHKRYVTSTTSRWYLYT